MKTFFHGSLDCFVHIHYMVDSKYSVDGLRTNFFKERSAEHRTFFFCFVTWSHHRGAITLSFCDRKDIFPLQYDDDDLFGGMKYDMLID